MAYYFKKNTPIFIGSDHAGFGYKQTLVSNLQQDFPNIKDKGTHSDAQCDYPDYAKEVARLVASQEETAIGILLCGSANGMAMTANKHPQIRAAICWNDEIVLLARKHNDANILCIPARFVTIEEALHITKSFLSTPFEKGRHQRRIDKIV